VILLTDGMIKEITTQDKFLDDILTNDDACRCRIGCVKEEPIDAECSR
jgi:hypothetical protein